MVEHVSTCEKKNEDQAYRGPEVAVLDNRHQILPYNTYKRDSTQNAGDNCDPEDPIDWPNNRRVWAVRHLAGNPAVNALCGLGSCVILAMDMNGKYDFEGPTHW